MDKPKCYIPINLRDYYKTLEETQVFLDKTVAIKAILSVYLDYRCLPTELNDQEPDDPAGLGILELLCIKLITIPKHTAKIRKVYANLDELYDQLINRPGSNIIQIIDQTFTLEELRDYGF